ncbi:MAG: D-alanine--D-alanine ligase [Alphaproteobacteria bacterium]
MNKSKRIAVLVGGWAVERDISISSGKEIIKALKEMGYDVTVINVSRCLGMLLKDITKAKPDIIFNALHGRGGEDGVIQGVLEVLAIPYTHCGVLSSALAMDKVLSRKIFEREKLPVPKWCVLPFKGISNTPPFEKPFVVKPINEGSSFGISIINKDDDLKSASKNWYYGKDALIEEYIKGHEISVMVLNEKAIGAIKIDPPGGFYDYRAKYKTAVSKYIMPAPLSDGETKNVLDMSLAAYKALKCRSLVRVDFRYDENKRWYLLELNTQPGFTGTSLCAQIASYYEMSFNELVEDVLINAKCDMSL